MPVVTYRYQALKESLAAAITSSSAHGDPRRPHALAVISGLATNGYLASLLVARYARLGHPDAARGVFDAAAAAAASPSSSSSSPKPLLYNAMLRAYLALGLPREAAALFRAMPSVCPPDRHTYHLAATACARAPDPELGRRVGAGAAASGLASDLLVATALVGMHAEAGDMAAARGVFDGVPRPDAVAWGAVIGGYARAGRLGEAVEMFGKMRSRGMMHGVVVKSGFHCSLFVSNALLEMYAELCSLSEAVMVFRHMEVKDSVTWSSLIGGLVRNGKPGHAVRLFRWMVLNSEVLVTRSILLNVIMACAELGNWREGKWIEENYVLCNGSEFKRDPSVVTALIYMYAKCGQLGLSESLLHGSAEVRSDLVAWNSLIKGCGELGQVEKAIRFTIEMQRMGIDPDAVTFLEILPMISLIPSLKKGTEAHAQIVKRGFQNERTIANSLISMYGRCGSLSLSVRAFTGILDKDAISWTSMMQVYAWNGLAAEVSKHFELMKETEVQPNHYTFVAVLTACKNTGLVEEGMGLLKCMKEQYGLEPDIEHISCVVDLLCRSGRLTDAYHLIQSSHSEHAKNPILWGTLLSGSRSWQNLVIGEAVARHLLSLDPENRANYKMLADIYVSLGRTDNADDVLRLLTSRELDLRPGCSWTEGG
ncbi:putative pentatricopeptide repeat-containing protein [Dichanthelium oligosanthes]|uniref:Putative pentatricopeptide repeat-containing protein n=1 Tax=Dichanthelium oligosanthes TaxID=888268 RepID=A0A1E5V453_9POAL|nr:putative pentatricopeptide repeat-containing protein [Dichanthelium oligosanthes]